MYIRSNVAIFRKNGNLLLSKELYRLYDGAKSGYSNGDRLVGQLAVSKQKRHPVRNADATIDPI